MKKVAIVSDTYSRSRNVGDLFKYVFDTIGIKVKYANKNFIQIDGKENLEIKCVGKENLEIIFVSRKARDYDPEYGIRGVIFDKILYT